MDSYMTPGDWVSIFVACVVPPLVIVGMTVYLLYIVWKNSPDA